MTAHRLLLLPLFALTLLLAGCPGNDDALCEGPDCACPAGAVEYPEFGCLDSGYADNDRDYAWYLTQMGTGDAESANCGPTSVAMALRWYDPAQDVSVATIRETITPGETGWWYTDDIEAALARWETPARIVGATEATLLGALDEGRVALICITMDRITLAAAPRETHFDRFYSYDSGHFLIVKGYIGDGEWLIVHDPNNWTGDYYDEAGLLPLGEDRYYRTSEVLDSMAVWWPYFFEIGIAPAKDHGFIPVGHAGPSAR